MLFVRPFLPCVSCLAHGLDSRYGCHSSGARANSSNLWIAPELLLPRELPLELPLPCRCPDRTFSGSRTVLLGSSRGGFGLCLLQRPGPSSEHCPFGAATCKRYQCDNVMQQEICKAWRHGRREHHCRGCLVGKAPCLWRPPLTIRAASVIARSVSFRRAA